MEKVRCPVCKRVVEPEVIFKPAAEGIPEGNYLKCPACGTLMEEVE